MSQKVDNVQNNEEEFPIKYFILSVKKTFALLKSKSRKIIFAIILFSLVGLTVSLMDKPKYKATMTFALVEDKGSGGGGLTGALGIASTLGIDLGGGGGGLFSSSNLSELFKSRLVIAKALLSPIVINGDKKTLFEYYIEINNIKDKWKGDSRLANLTFKLNDSVENFSFLQDSILKKVHAKLLEENLNFTQKDKKISILTLEVTSKDEIFAKFFCESLAKQLSSFYIDTKSKKARINVDILQKQADSIRQELNNAIYGVASEIDKFYNLNPSLNTKSSSSRKRQIDVQANTAILTQLVAQLELSKVNLRKETPLIQIIDSPIYPLEKEKISKLKAIFYGGFLGAFLSSMFIIIASIYRKIMDN